MTPETMQDEQNMSLRSFLQDELDDARHRLDQVQDKIEKQKARSIRAWFGRLRGKINEDDYKALRDEWQEKNNRLKEIPDNDVRLFLLRKEIGSLKEEVEALEAGPRWKLPASAWVMLILLPFVIYFFSLAVVQGRNQEKINTYATQTAEAMPSPVPSPTMMPTPIPTTIQ